ncbi:hypothetical protein COV23_00235 [Candidatus Wolfebacteria bacterium CG10_big_fil_rev_8_21_14_0_10_31_9]|uniref:SHS2 domain-containing protein n=1 Tax=Candidatus Wolfebacteria bacterium CG10_big_fil_rev_8_21_14_0_10_31_9 TaxID=1975070 RepID=A0A2H0RCX9_9BACT|nr:MAG: hypothetical protein COV23_00235 [Candidatus Wolfebacteria bacterium CG10_big_fil_rev_8_21_14_0_10_31_9]
MLFDSAKSLLSQSHLGVDIGTTSIKIVELVKSGNQPVLKNYGILETYNHLERVNNAIQTSSLKIAETDTAELLKTLVKRAEFSTKNVIASIPAFSAFVTLFELPQMTDTEVSKTMDFQIGQYIPIPLNEVSIEWKKVGERQDEQGFVKQQILLISIPNDVITKYKNIFKIAGLNLIAIEVESQSLIRAATFSIKDSVLVVDIGSRSTEIIAVNNGEMRYSYQTDYSSSGLTYAIAKGLGVNIRRAEKLKKEKGLLGGQTSELSTLMIPYLNAIINEIRRAKNKYEQTFAEKIGFIILTGGGSKLLGIEKYIEAKMEIPSAVSNPFSLLSYPGNLEPIIKEMSSSFSVAIGLALKDFI